MLAEGKIQKTRGSVQVKLGREHRDSSAAREHAAEEATDGNKLRGHWSCVPLTDGPQKDSRISLRQAKAQERMQIRTEILARNAANR
jgi:hypothetical protein